MAIELHALQDEFFDASKNFKASRINYRSSLIGDDYTEKNLKLKLLWEYLNGMSDLAEFHLDNREKHPDHYITDQDYENYQVILEKARKPKCMETRFFLKNLAENEWPEVHVTPENSEGSLYSQDM